MAKLDVTELDFETIKSNLKAYLAAQSEFQDYNFEGSAMNVLLDTLAYNTHYNSVLAHLVGNEAFIDTATKRASVVSIAKGLGYTPRSVRGSTATINFRVVPPVSNSNSTLTLSRDTAFTSVINSTSYLFYPRNSVTVNKETRTIGGVAISGFFFDNVQITEGTRISNSFVVTSNTLSGPFTIPNNNIDTSSMRVRVRESQSDLTISTYLQYTNLTDVGTTTKAYFIEEDVDGLYLVRFGDNYVGKKLTDGNVVVVDYIASNGEAANGANRFSGNSGTFISNDEVITITTVYNASGGSGKESIDSIRKTAPRFNQTRNRAITSADYQALILASNSNIQSCAVWGGETNDPPIYGKVFISLDPYPNQIITDADKAKIQTEILDPKAPVGILTEFVDPNYVYIQLRIGATYNPKVTALTMGEITSTISTAVGAYFTNSLNVLNKDFYLSDLHRYVKESSSSIISVNINPKLQIRKSAMTLGKSESFTLSFNNKIEPRTLHSTWFNVNIGTGNYDVKLQDVPRTGVNPPEYTGLGDVYLYGKKDNKNLGLVGIVNYDTGRVTFITQINSYSGTDSFVRINAKPHDDVKDIKTQTLTRVSEVNTSAVVALPSKNTVLTLDDTQLNTTTGARKGLDIVISQQVINE